jgi:predicted PurR-regulated permease PerM
MAPAASRDNIRLVFVTVILLGLAVYLFDVLLLFFAGVLLAVVIRAPSEWLSRTTGLDARVALVLVLIVLATLFGLAAWLVGHSVAQELESVWKRLPQAIEELEGRASDMAVVGPAMEKAASEGPAAAARSGLATVLAAFGLLTNFALVLFVAILLAMQPRLYVEGSLHLLPKKHRKRAAELFGQLGNVLKRWTLGQLCLMTLVGLLSYAGFRAIGLEFAGALALLAGALTFIPFLGSLAAGAIAVLMALAQGVDMALYTAAVYACVQIIENVCEPFVQQRAVYLAPALLLFAQAVLGALAGPLGIVLATPLAAVAIVTTKMLYVEDTLGDHQVKIDA